VKFYGAREDIGSRHRQSGWAPFHPDYSSNERSISPIFTPDALPAATLPIYSGLVQTHIQPFYGPFSGTTQVSQCQKKKSSSGLYGAWEDNKGTLTDNPAACHSIRTNQ